MNKKEETIKEEMSVEEMSVEDAINALKKVYTIRLEEYPIRTKHLTEILKT